MSDVPWMLFFVRVLDHMPQVVNSDQVEDRGVVL
jgi:hypothetical protein